MVELIGDGLEFRFPEVHPDAVLRMTFQRTLRIPDNGTTYPLPPGLGAFPLRHVDDFDGSVPAAWTRRGGVLLPMYQSEAMWLHFLPGYIEDREVSYPFAIQIAAGKINAVSGAAWAPGLSREPQNYLVAPGQRWLDGFAVEKGVIRQFVAMPLGSGYSAEEQITGQAEHGGLQIMVRPMKRDVFERRFPVPSRQLIVQELIRMPAMCAPDMGLAPGGRMTQELFEDPYAIGDWAEAGSNRCFVHILNSLVWQAVTSEKPPYPPTTASEYRRHRLPWFEYYDDSQKALGGSQVLNRLRSVIEMARSRGENAVADNEDVAAEPVIVFRPRTRKPQVREGGF